MRKTVVINYHYMQVGGIENYISQFVNYAIDNEYRVIWLCDKHASISPIYAQQFESKKIERCKYSDHGFHWFSHEKVLFDKDEVVVILSFSFFDQARALELKRRNRHLKITAIYAIPHFTGELIFPEQALSGYFRAKAKKCVGRIYEEWIKEGLLTFFSNKHIQEVKTNYGIEHAVCGDQGLPRLKAKPLVSDEEYMSRYNSSKFRIVTATRFEFPHKGYILGLVKEFSSLKEKYPNLELIIIGEGAGKEELVGQIQKLPISARNAVSLKGVVSFDEMLAIFRCASLNIGVAGCAVAGQRVGLITLPARNYTYNCEVYGFFPESIGLTTETRPGYPVGPYIEQAINLTCEQYVALSRKTYDSYVEKPVAKDYLFNISGIDQNYMISKGTLAFIKLLFFLQKSIYLRNKFQQFMKRIFGRK